MPTYEYACKACGEHLEVVQSFRDEALKECPACGGPLRKVFGSIGIAFKGSGFYKNDSRPAPKGDKGDKAEKSEKSEKSGDGAKGPDKATKGDKKAEPAKSEKGGSKDKPKTKTEAASA